MKNLRKFLTIGVMGLTALGMTGFSSFANAAAPQAGDLIKMDGLSAVYFLGNDGKRYVFPSESVFYSWHNDFSGVVTISASELASYPLGANVTVRPGTKLVKITTDPSVYAVEANGTLRKIASEADAIAIFGANWAKRVIDVSDAFFTNYTISTPLTSGQIPAGTLVKNANSGAIYLYDGTNYRSIANEAAFNANRFNFANVITVSNAITAGGTAITGAETLNYDAQTNSTGPVTVVTGSGLTASLSSNTPAATTIVGGQAIAALTSFNLTAANDGAITVKSIKFKRTGVSSDNSLTNVYLYNGNTKLTDAGSLSNGYVTFANNTGIITVAAGQTVTVTVKADVATGSSATGNIGMSINAASDITSTGATVYGSFPIVGNLMSVTSVTDLAKVSVTGTTTGSGNVNAGTMAATLWSNNLNVSNKAVKLNYVSFRQIGSISADAIQNIKLYVNGAQAGVYASIDTNGRVNFDLSANPILLNTGSSLMELRGDIVKGSNYNFTFSIQTPSDIVLTDTNYGVNVALDSTVTTLPLSPASATINAGNVSVQRDVNFTATQFVANQSQTVLGQWTMKAYGEDIKVQSLSTLLTLTGIMSANEGFNNVSVYVDGATVGSSQNAVSGFTTTGAGLTTSNAKTLTFGSTNLFTIPAGTTVTVVVKGDSVLNQGTTITAAKVDLVNPINSLQGITSFTYTPSVAATTQGVSLTAGTSNATVSANGSYSSQSLSGNTNKQKIGSFMIQASSADGVNVTSLKVGLNYAASTTALSAANLNKLANLYIVTPDMANGSTPVSPSSVNNFSTNFTVAANQSAQVDVYADISDASLVPFATTLVGNGNGSTSHQSVALSSATGQTITTGNGSLSTLSLSTASPVKQIIVGGTTGQAVATYNFVAATTGGVTISELGFNFGSSTAISSVTVGGSTASVVNGKALVTGLSLVVPASYGGLDVPVTANFAPVGLNGVTDQTVTMALAHVKYLAGGATTIAGTNPVVFAGDATSTLFGSFATGTPANTMYVAGVAPIVSLVPATGNLTTGIVKIGSVSILAPTGSMSLKQLPITLGVSGATLATSSAIVVKDSATGNTIVTTGNVASITGGTTNIVVSPWDTISSGTTAKTYDIYVNVATIAGNAGTGRVTLGLDTVNLNAFLWKDINGNGDLDATFIKNFPNTTVSIVN